MASTPVPHILFVLLPCRSEYCLPFIAAAGKVTFLTQLNPGQLFIVQMPKESIYMPDMLVDIVALKQYAALNKGEYASTVDTWVDKAKEEWLDHSPILGMDIDAGPVIMGLSPSGTAFSTGAATFFNDNEVRSNILRTAEICGNTLSSGNKKHYALANIALVGEAIMLAMRTNAPANL